MKIFRGEAGIKRGQEVNKERAANRVDYNDPRMTRRFFLQQGASATVTFLDGGLTDNNYLDAISYDEHAVAPNGDYTKTKYIGCTEDEGYCLPCLHGERKSVVWIFRVINHTPYVSTATGKEYVNQVQLLVAKEDAASALQVEALRNGGLIGAQVVIARSIGKQSSRIGDSFTVTRKDDLNAVLNHFNLTNMPPLEKYLPSYTRAEVDSFNLFPGQAPSPHNQAPKYTQPQVPQGVSGGYTHAPQPSTTGVQAGEVDFRSRASNSPPQSTTTQVAPSGYNPPPYTPPGYNQPKPHPYTQGVEAQGYSPYGVSQEEKL